MMEGISYQRRARVPWRDLPRVSVRCRRSGMSPTVLRRRDCADGTWDEIIRRLLGSGGVLGALIIVSLRTIGHMR